MYMHKLMLFMHCQQEQKERRRKLHTEHGMWQNEMEERRAEDKRRRLELRCGKRFACASLIISNNLVDSVFSK